MWCIKEAGNMKKEIISLIILCLILLISVQIVFSYAAPKGSLAIGDIVVKPQKVQANSNFNVYIEIDYSSPGGEYVEIRKSHVNRYIAIKDMGYSDVNDFIKVSDEEGNVLYSSSGGLKSKRTHEKISDTWTVDLPLAASDEVGVHTFYVEILGRQWNSVDWWGKDWWEHEFTDKKSFTVEVVPSIRKEKKEEEPECGDDKCELYSGENCKNCEEDCYCPEGVICDPSNEYANAAGCVIDFCYNNRLDPGEEQTDCGGVCEPCDYVVKITPSKSVLFADGESSEKFTLTATLYGEPVEGLTYKLLIRKTWASVFKSLGKLSKTEMITGSDGKASFTYTAPTAPEEYFEDAEIDITVSGVSGDYIYVTLKDPKPLIYVELKKMSMIEGQKGDEMNFADVTIEDEDSEEWNIRVTTSIGSLVRTGRGGGKVHTLLDKTKSKEYHFNWKPPESAVELIDSYMTMVKDQKADWKSAKSNLINSDVDTTLEQLSNMDVVGKLAMLKKYGGKSAKIAAELKSYYDQYKNWKGNVAELQRDIHEIQTSTSTYERFLRATSMCLEGWQISHGTKMFIHGKLGKDARTLFEKFVEQPWNYGIDSLQTGLRLGANWVREGNHDTIRIPVHVIVEVTDEDGFTGRKNKVFQYTYHVNPNE